MFQSKEFNINNFIEEKNNQKKTFNRLNFEAKNEKEIIHRKVRKKKLVGIFFSESLLENQNGFPLEEGS